MLFKYFEICRWNTDVDMSRWNYLSTNERTERDNNVPTTKYSVTTKI